jgi:hypothetical protein
LVDVDERTNMLLQTVGECFARGLDGAVLLRDGAEGCGGEHSSMLGEEDDVRHVDALQVDRAGMEIFEKAKEPREAVTQMAR